MSPSRLVIPLLALFVAACQPSATASPTASAPPASAPAASATVAGELRPVTLLLGFRPDVQFAPFYVAQREGFYADAGLEVTIQHEPAPDVQRLVASGDAEFGVADATDVMIARTQEIPIKDRKSTRLNSSHW